MKPNHSGTTKQASTPKNPIQWIIFISTSLLFALWGMILIQRLSSLFSSYSFSSVPGVIWLVQVLHIALLAGYLLIFRKPRLGAIVLSFSGVLFFSFTAGKNIIPYTFVSLIPSFLVFYTWFRDRKTTYPK